MTRAIVLLLCTGLSFGGIYVGTGMTAQAVEFMACIDVLRRSNCVNNYPRAGAIAITYVVAWMSYGWMAIGWIQSRHLSPAVPVLGFTSILAWFWLMFPPLPKLGFTVMAGVAVWALLLTGPAVIMACFLMVHHLKLHFRTRSSKRAA